MLSVDTLNIKHEKKKKKGLERALTTQETPVGLGIQHGQIQYWRRETVLPVPESPSA